MQRGWRSIPVRKNIALWHGLWLHPCDAKIGGNERLARHCVAEVTFAGRRRAMKRCRMQVFYSGHVQGVGFRFTVRRVAMGFEVAGVVRNLSDSRVELVVEGDRAELEAFREAIRESGLAANIRREDVSWTEAQNEFRGFEIVR